MSFELLTGTAAGNLDGTELLPIAQGGEPRKLVMSKLVYRDASNEFSADYPVRISGPLAGPDQIVAGGTIYLGATAFSISASDVDGTTVFLTNSGSFQRANGASAHFSWDLTSLTFSRAATFTTTATFNAAARFGGDANFNMNIVSSKPSIVYDSQDFLRYDRTANKWEWLIANVVVGSIDATGVSVATVTFDSGDFLTYNRTTNIYSFNIGNSAVLSIDGGGLLGTGTFTNTGLRIQDTDASHTLTIAPGSNLTASRTFTLITGDVSRTLDISAADVTIASGAAAALGIATGSAGAVVLFNGAGGTPSSLTLTNATGLPLTTGVTGDLPFANLAQGSARSVLGVTGNSTADVASIQGTANQVLVINSGGTALSFGQVNLASSAAVTGTLPVGNGGTGITAFGTGVATALGVNVGSAGAFVTFNGAGGTPSSLTLTNATGLPVAGITASTSTALGVGSVELGHATDTTVSRASAGDIQVEGNRIFRVGGTDVPVADGGTGASSAQLACQNLSAPYTVAQSGAAVIHTGDTTETTAATISIPAGAMGANGSIYIDALFTCTANANTELFKVKLGGTLLGTFGATSDGVYRFVHRIWNANSQSSQKAMAAGTGGVGSTGSGMATAAINTANAQNLTITITAGNSADTVTLEAYTITLQYGA